MRAYGVAWVATAVVFLGLDAVWLSFSATRLYRPLLGGLLRDGFLLTPAVLFYVTYTIGIVVFAVSPEFASGRWAAAGIRGAFLGLFGYAVYDLTNQATLRDWPRGCDNGRPRMGDASDRRRRDCGPAGGACIRDGEMKPAQSFIKPESMSPSRATSALALKAFNRTKAAYSVCE